VHLLKREDTTGNLSGQGENTLSDEEKYPLQRRVYACILKVYADSFDGRPVKIKRLFL